MVIKIKIFLIQIFHTIFKIGEKTTFTRKTGKRSIGTDFFFIVYFWHPRFSFFVDLVYCTVTVNTVYCKFSKKKHPKNSANFHRNHVKKVKKLFYSLFLIPQIFLYSVNFSD